MVDTYIWLGKGMQTNRMLFQYQNWIICKDPSHGPQVMHCRSGEWHYATYISLHHQHLIECGYELRRRYLVTLKAATV